MRIHLVVILLLSTIISFATWSPIIRHFTPQDYNAGTQNWDIIEHTNGWVYIANNYGLLETDGAQWNLYGIHNGTALRSLVLGEDGAIYVGGTDEFGVFRSDGLGGLSYENLSTLIPERYRNFGEVWRLQIHHHNLYIQTRHYIFIYDPSGNVEVLDPGAIIYESLIWEGNLYLATSRDLYVQSGGRLHALRGTEALHNMVVCSMLPYGEKGIMIATDFHGLFLYDGQNIQPFHTEVDAYIAENQLYTIAIGNQQLALGTVQGGLVITDEMGNNSQFINRDNGLQNNTILSLKYDSKNNLWLGLDNGIDICEYAYPILFYRDAHIDYGSGYASVEFNNHLYLGTNQGLYCASNHQPQLTFVEGSQGQVWSLTPVGNTLFCCHNRGLFIVDDHRLVPINCHDGVWKICPISSSSAIVGTYMGFYHLYRSAQGDWQTQYLSGFAETALYFALDTQHHLWLLSSRGIEKVIPDFQRNTLHAELIIEQPSSQRTFSITSLYNQILITSDNQCFAVDSLGNITSDSPLLNRLNGMHRYLNITTDIDDNIWYIYEGRIAVRRYNTLTQSYDPEQVVWYAPTQLIGGFTSLIPCQRGGVFIGGVNGFYYLHLPAQSTPQSSHIYIRQIQSLTAEATLLYGEAYNDMPSTIIIPPLHRTFRVQLSGNYAAAETPLFRTRLYPLEKDFTPWQQQSYRDFIALPAGGDYQLDIQMLSSDGQITTRTTPVQLLYPFYLTWWAKAIYICLAIGLACFVIWRIHLRIQRSKQRLAETKNQEIYQQQLRILQLENEKAQNDLRNKSQELSNMLLSEANRKEWNSEVLNEIHRIIDCLNTDRLAEAKGKMQHLQNRLARNGETSINWNRFEENFDIVHNQFISKLTLTYPWLSKQERRLCVYIHIGLSSKEIAPLLNLTQRAVEMMRYRIRNKMQLDASMSLKQHFSSLQNYTSDANMTN